MKKHSQFIVLCDMHVLFSSQPTNLHYIFAKQIYALIDAYNKNTVLKTFVFIIFGELENFVCEKGKIKWFL